MLAAPGGVGGSLFFSERYGANLPFRIFLLSLCLFTFKTHKSRRGKEGGRQRKRKRKLRRQVRPNYFICHGEAVKCIHCLQQFGQVSKKGKRTSFVKWMNTQMSMAAAQKHRGKWKRQIAEVLYCLNICVMFKNTWNNSASCLLTQM